MVLKGTGMVEGNLLELTDVPTPQPDPNQLLVKISVCGACHTELDEIEGRLLPTKMPIILGHQIVGEVVEAGAEVSKFKIGSRVGITWLNSSCQKCEFCLAGNENLCPNAKWTGKDVDGGYAQYTIISENFAHPIPESFSDAQAAPLLCAGVIGYRALRLCQMTDGQTLALYGFGASAHIVIQIAKFKYPNSTIFAFTRGTEHQDMAKDLGAAWVGRLTDTPPGKIDKAIDFTPVGETVHSALNQLNPGGRLVINAIRKINPIPELDYAKQLWHEKEIKSVANVTNADAAEFLRLAGQIPIIPAIQEFELAQANEVLLSIKQSKTRAAAVLAIPD